MVGRDSKRTEPGAQSAPTRVEPTQEAGTHEARQHDTRRPAPAEAALSHSPRMLAQRRQMEGMFGPALDRTGSPPHLESAAQADEATLSDSPRVLAQRRQMDGMLGAARNRVKADATPHGTQAVVQRVVSIGAAVLIDEPLQQLRALLQHQPSLAVLDRMANDRQNTYAFATPGQLVAFLRNLPGNDPIVSPIAPQVYRDAKRARNRERFHSKTVRESPLARHDAFHEIPREQLYQLGDDRFWRRNEQTQQYERFRKKDVPKYADEELFEYLDPNNPKRENYGYRRGDQVITTRTDPRSSAGYSRSGAAGKIQYTDARGGFKSKRKFPGTSGAVVPFKNATTNVTNTIGHSHAVKNMSAAKDHTGLNSDQQPKMMVPENRTVGEQMKNPALEPSDRSYVWNNIYSPNPARTYSGAPIPTHTEATLFNPDDTLDVNIRLRNDGTVNYRDEREKYRLKHKLKDVSYDTYMRAETTAPYVPPKFFDSDEEDDIDLDVEVPQTPAYFPGYSEADTVSTTDMHEYGSHIAHKGDEWTVGEMTKTGKSGQTYSLRRTKHATFDATTLQGLQQSLGGTAPQQTGSGAVTTPVAHTPVAHTSVPVSTHPKPLTPPPPSHLPVPPQGGTPFTQPFAPTTATLPLLPPLTHLFSPPPPVKHPIPKLKASLDGVLSLTDSLVDALRNTPGGQSDVAQVLKFRKDASDVDLTDFRNESQIESFYRTLYATFRQLAPHLHRRLTPSGGDMHGPNGFRLAALEQYLAECGQMAAHNAIALEVSGQEPTPFQNLGQHTGDRAALSGLGGFENQVNEDRIRQMLVTAGRQGIPVISYLHQLDGFVARYNQERANDARQGTNHTAWLLLRDLGVQHAQLQEIAAVSRFLSGATDRLNMIVNTDAHRGQAIGYHWITVRLERDPLGRIGIFYLDSLQGVTDYRVLFAALRRFVSG